MFTIAIVGRPNVGKSSLFNRLVGKKHAIVHDRPGVTRDRKEDMGNIGPMEFRIIDTPGLEEDSNHELAGRMKQQTEAAVLEANLILFLIDGKVGIIPDDLHYARWLLKFNKPVIIVGNKCENRATIANMSGEIYQLSAQDHIFISAEHGDGMIDLYEAIDPYHKENSLAEEKSDSINIAIVGRPNVGKSTLVNTLLKTDRMLTGPEAGITRDSVASEWEYKGQKIKLVDTAGIRRKKNISDSLEKLSVNDTLRAINFAQIVVMVMDANAPFEAQDVTIANKIIDEGRAIIIAINKWDSITNKDEVRAEITHQFEQLFSQIKGAPVIYISGLHGKNLDKLFDAAIDLLPLWSKRVSTSPLNDWLHYALERHPLPLAPSGRRVKIKYITQAKSRPPTFMLFANHPDAVRESYLRYLTHSLREAFDLHGVPIRMVVRKSGVREE
jgi:GTP-binding protein